MNKLSKDLYGFTDNMHERAIALEAERDRAVDELIQCRAILDRAGDHSTSIHGGISSLVCERDHLKRALGLETFKAEFEVAPIPLDIAEILSDHYDELT